MIYVRISFYIVCVYRSILYNNPSKHIPNTPRKLGQGHIGLGRVDIVPFVLATAEIDSRPQTYLHRPRLFGLAWLAADEKKIVNVDWHSSETGSRMIVY
jgi:hypothetical protein